ncbi:LANO_0C03796g1_1 [Lachancea nothofagi CBS 11611]|uniref:LANO_0C03796g1_1 n=1 Tax=Lachancea nothofagi CBS 11611 TaxID=1266666 RepID=A0A1G4J6A8_9SACH|nr:LANO_0C03796g1_1 [Lachancea nothofagi CBS 11611]
MCVPTVVFIWWWFSGLLFSPLMREHPSPALYIRQNYFTV